MLPQPVTSKFYHVIHLDIRLKGEYFEAKGGVTNDFMTATEDDHGDGDNNRRICNMTSSFFLWNDGDGDGYRHQ